MMILLTSVIAIATCIYAYFAVLSWKEQRQSVHLEFLNSLDNLADDINNSYNLGPFDQPIFISEFKAMLKARLLKEWFPKEHQQFTNVANDVFKRLKKIA